MDPLSIAAGAIAVFQATDRLGSLLSRIKPFLTAPNDVAALLDELKIIRDALGDLQRVVAIEIPISESPTLNITIPHRSVTACLIHVSHLEELISSTCKFQENFDQVKVLDVKRLVWVRKQGDIGRIKNRLRDAMSVLYLVLSSLNHTSQVNLSISMEKLEQSLQHFQISFEIPSANLPEHTEQTLHIEPIDTGVIPNFVPRQREVHHALGLPLLDFPPVTRCLSEAATSHKYDNPTGEILDSISSFGIGPKSSFRCSYQGSGFLTIGLLTRTFGVLLVDWTGEVLHHSTCDHESCTKRLIPSISFTYYGSNWIANLVTRFSFRMSSPLSFSLSFPQIRSPDAEIFLSIRLGNAERVKSLLIEGRGSVADVLGPYGFSPLLLAIIYQQHEIYQLLVSSGASRAPQIHITCPGSHLEIFWTTYVSQDYRISASDVLRDYTRQLSPLPHTQLLANLGQDSILDSSSFTRIHKCTVGLTSECLEAILPVSQDEIDATDSLGRTALHLAAYQCNSKAIQLLLDFRGNPNTLDQYGKAPLHIAAGSGSVSTTHTLIAGGSNLEICDQFGNTPLHLACLLGHHQIVQLLLDAGADIEATNVHGETAVRQTILTDQLEVARLLHQRGCAFNAQDGAGSNAMFKAVWFNAHRVFRFLLTLQLRFDQKHRSGRTILHTLADNGDALTMQLFLGSNHPSLARLDVADFDSRGWTAMDYLKSRRNASELMAPFRRVLEHVQIARQHGEAMPFEKLKSVAELSHEADKDDIFFDAVEIQV